MAHFVALMIDQHGCCVDHVSSLGMDIACSFDTGAHAWTQSRTLSWIALQSGCSSRYPGLTIASRGGFVSDIMARLQFW